MNQRQSKIEMTPSMPVAGATTKVGCIIYHTRKPIYETASAFSAHQLHAPHRPVSSLTSP